MEMLLKAEIGGKTLSIQTGKVAKQASGSVYVQYGETIVLVTVVGSPEERDMGFLPLTVEYQEKIYSAGRIPGNYFRREKAHSRNSSEVSSCTPESIPPMTPAIASGLSWSAMTSVSWSSVIVRSSSRVNCSSLLA